jgi:hypothetical protein
MTINLSKRQKYPYKFEKKNSLEKHFVKKYSHSLFSFLVFFFIYIYLYLIFIKSIFVIGDTMIIFDSLGGY